MSNLIDGHQEFAGLPAEALSAAGKEYLAIGSPSSGRRASAAIWSALRSPLKFTDSPAKGPLVDIRDLRPDEGAVLDDLMARLSPRSRYLRFHAAVGSLSAVTRRALLDVDGRDHVALVAEIGGLAVGIASFRQMPGADGAAEVAIAVADDHQRRGIGRQLLKKLVDRAATVQIDRLEAHLLSWNVAALGLARAVFSAVITRRDTDGIHLVCPVGPGLGFDITMEDLMAELLS